MVILGKCWCYVINEWTHISPAAQKVVTDRDDLLLSVAIQSLP